MNTYAIQLLLHFQSTRTDDCRFDAFLEELRGVAERHGVTFDDFQSMQLSATNYTIGPCTSCGDLTVNREDVDAGIENMLPDFWFHVRRGNLLSGNITCEFCQSPARAT